MKRGTTPTIRMTLKGVSIENLSSIYVTIKQGIVVFDAEDVIRENSSNYLIINLTQEETLRLQAGEAMIQMRAMTNDGQAIATDRIKLNVGAILKEGLIS